MYSRCATTSARIPDRVRCPPTKWSKIILEDLIMCVDEPRDVFRFTEICKRRPPGKYDIDKHKYFLLRCVNEDVHRADDWDLYTRAGEFDCRR